MAQVTGLIQQIKFNPILDTAFVWLGPNSNNTTLYYLQTNDGDGDAETAVKLSLIDGLSVAMLSGRTVTLTTASSNPPEILSATINPA